MKDKNKKFLTGLGVGALACVGMFGLTGCANVNIPQEKVDSMVETVERADKYLAFLESQQNNLTKQEAADKVNLAMFKIFFNQEGILDNMKMKSTNEKGDKYESIYYVTSNGTRMFYDYMEADGNYHTVVYDIDRMNTAVCEWVNDEEVDKEIIFNPEVDFFAGNIFEYSSLHSMGMFLLNTTSDNIVSCEKTEDGNYNIVVYKETGITDIGNIYANMIIDEQNRILSMTTGSIDFTDMDYVYFGTEPTYIFEYNTITDADVEDVLSKAQNTQNQKEAIILYNQAYYNLMNAETLRVDLNGTTEGVEQDMQTNIKDNKAYIKGNAENEETIQEWYQFEEDTWFDYTSDGTSYKKYALTDSNVYSDVNHVVGVYILFMGGDISEEILETNQMTISHEYIDGNVKITLTFNNEELDEGDGPIIATISNGKFIEMEASFDDGNTEVKNTYSYNEEDVEMLELPDVDWVLTKND